MYAATYTVGKDSTQCLVKFTADAYGEAVHRAAAAAGIAPRLLKCERMEGGFTMVRFFLGVFLGVFFRGIF